MRPWLTPKPDPAFQAKCAEICTVYRDAAATPAVSGGRMYVRTYGHLISVGGKK